MFYANYVRLCNSIEKSPSAVALELGLQKASVTRWKKGGKPTDATAQKIAGYFGVTADALFGDAQKEAPIQSDGREISDDDIKFALFKGASEITDEMYKEVQNFAEFIKKREADKKEG